MSAPALLRHEFAVGASKPDRELVRPLGIAQEFDELVAKMRTRPMLRPPVHTAPGEDVAAFSKALPHRILGDTHPGCVRGAPEKGCGFRHSVKLPRS